MTRQAQGVYQSAPEQRAAHRRIDELRQRGISVSEIAIRLYFSESTVRRHLAHECNCLNGKRGLTFFAEEKRRDR